MVELHIGVIVCTHQLIFSMQCDSEVLVRKLMDPVLNAAEYVYTYQVLVVLCIMLMCINTYKFSSPAKIRYTKSSANIT